MQTVAHKWKLYVCESRSTYVRDGQVPVGVHDEVVTFSKVLFVVCWSACVVHVDAIG